MYEKYYYQSLICDILGKRVWEDVPPNNFDILLGVVCNYLHTLFLS